MPRREWSVADDKQLCAAVAILGAKGQWTRIAIDFFYGSKTASDCKDRYERVLHFGTASSPWTAAEDKFLMQRIQKDPELDWHDIASSLLDRTPEECQRRYHQLHATEKSWTFAEDLYLKTAVSHLGPNWHTIAQIFPSPVTAFQLASRFRQWPS